jgi:hypothetical protein
MIPPWVVITFLFLCGVFAIFSIYFVFRVVWVIIRRLRVLAYNERLKKGGH